MTVYKKIIQYGAFNKTIWKKHLLVLCILLVVSPTSLIFLHLYSYYTKNIWTIFIFSGMSISLLPTKILMVDNLKLIRTYFNDKIMFEKILIFIILETIHWVIYTFLVIIVSFVILVILSK